MKTSDFTNQPKVVEILTKLKNDNIHQEAFSDVIDDEGHQYVELVQEGGGVLGVALVGYTYILEQMGIRFFSLAGTSAGSINAMALAGYGDVSKSKSEKIIEAVVNKKLIEFVDGNSDSRDFIDALVKKARRIKLIWKGWQVIDELYEDLGLNPGDDFLNWLTEILTQNGVHSLKDLDNLFGKIPETLKIRDGVDKTIDGLKPRLAVITAELTTGTKVEFPKMSKLYWKDTDTINPAEFVRASMSIPYFFSPFTREDIPNDDVAKNNWKELVKYVGDIPEKAFFVDGGIMSNFPVDVFHNKKSIPRLPTFGVKLGSDRDSTNKITNPLNLFGAMFTSIRFLHDYDFILRNPDYEHLVESIDVGDHDWLNFGITDEAQLDLFLRGAKAADQFLRRFKWEEYKILREKLKTTN